MVGELVNGFHAFTVSFVQSGVEVSAVDVGLVAEKVERRW